jgi:hypothetical protein
LASLDTYSCVKLKALITVPVGLSFVLYFNYIVSVGLMIRLNKLMIVAAMKRLQDMGASYFILDLRDNLGGLVQVCLLN